VSDSEILEGTEEIAIKRENIIKPKPTSVTTGPRLFIVKIIKLKPLLIHKNGFNVFEKI
jgi:hypothetical protein